MPLGKITMLTSLDYISIIFYVMFHNSRLSWYFFYELQIAIKSSSHIEKKDEFPTNVLPSIINLQATE